MMEDRFQRFSLALSEISRYYHKLSADEMRRLGLKGGHSVYLLTLERHPEGLTGAQLAEKCGKDKADVSRMLSILEEKGLAEGTDSHYRCLYRLTPSGHQAAERTRARAALATAMAGQDLSEEDRRILYSALASIADNLRTLSLDGIPEE